MDEEICLEKDVKLSAIEHPRFPHSFEESLPELFSSCPYFIHRSQHYRMGSAFVTTKVVNKGIWFQSHALQYRRYV